MFTLKMHVKIGSNLCPVTSVHKVAIFEAGPNLDKVGDLCPEEPPPKARVLLLCF
jgi:hypothetical protein